MNASLLVGLVLVLGAPGSKDEPKKDGPSILGEWIGVSAVAGGKDRPVPEGGVSITFLADGKLKVREGKRDKEDGSYKVDANKSPAELDLIPPADRKDVPAKGIFKFDGDKLIICLAGAGDRPTKFESPEGSQFMLMTLKRAKKE